MKYLKLIILAVVIIGAVFCLIYFIGPDSGEEDKGPDVSSAQAKEWKSQIDDLCKPDAWDSKEYDRIQSGIHIDRVTTNGDLLSLDEENALQKYLFTSSCDYLKKQTDHLFRQSTYPDAKIKESETIFTFLTSKAQDFDKNSNLKEAESLLTEYRQLLSAVSFNSQATYSQPLKPFGGMSAEAARSRINGLKHYNSHFKNNPTIKAKVDQLEANREKAEREYYENLEVAIENNYGKTHDLSALLDDQISFGEISTNAASKTKLENFVNNPRR
ncbi:MAG: hypothetical protein LUD17_11065 [Bacteroidales bacterium]|nr:hypothetical protein [Bacteroidales bacterium]